MSRAGRTLFIVLILSVLLPFISFLVPPPAEDTIILQVENFRAGLAGCVFFACLYAGAAVMFMIGLDIFKDRLKRAYAAICSGLVLLGLASVQVPILIALYLLDNSWGLGGGLLAPYVVGGLLLYLGLRSFAKALGDQSVWVSAWVVFGVTLVVAAVFAWLARDWPQLTFSHISFGGNIASTCLATAGLVLAIHIRSLAGPAYTNALSWFVVAMVANLFGQFPTTILEVMDIPENPLLAIPQVVTGALFLKAGYAFNKIKEY